ncbi:DUF3014 domain-containing protein [Shewanella litorisediminis]|uniref:DUF3014 domain-containing protein n=1 Tax=Shewanella litorisediminis TaxID=1173586 RepID=A0ABX7G2R3_9GAMM|nr:DUF3014 domain-containing protein [Shewanella litorisediminis]MCL2917110.1 DUF3014 domain-containing protein [Shewanella litorisediminis]QRH01587.1 DUF3014 domain-containing protein [Shewanella litorisediminis]
MQVNPEDRITPQEDVSQRSNRLSALLILALIAIAAGLWMYVTRSPEPAPVVEVPTEAPQPTPLPEPVVTDIEPEPAPEAQSEPQVVTNAPEEKMSDVVVDPIPELAESDTFATQKAVALAGDLPVQPIIAQQDLVRHFVVFMDNLAEGQLARKQSPLKGPEAKFTVSEITAKTYLNPDSYKRYDLYANYIANLNEEKLLETYAQMTPMLEQAFDELGYDNVSFKERSLKAIDQLLAAPIIESPIELVTFSVNYKFADPELEALPPAQKLMIRMGPENSRKVKAALKKLRPLLQ